MNEISTVVERLDRHERAIAGRAEKIRTNYDRLRDALESQNPAKVARALAIAEDFGRATGLGDSVQLATLSEIKHRVGALAVVMKNMEKVHPAAFLAQLVEDVAAENPTSIGLATAMRKLRTEEDYLPSIAAVIRAIRQVESDYRSTIYRASALPDRISEARAFLAAPSHSPA